MMVQVEICCGSYEDALQAAKNGAGRIELNSALYLGGLTPTLATLKLVKQQVDLPVICMVRPRGAGFCYRESECEVMFEEAKNLLEAGADGIAFGFLNNDRTIQKELTLKMTQLIHSYHKEAVFHRAFDCVEDPYLAMEQLIDCQVDRVLTSGLQASAIQGQTLIANLVNRYAHRIEILAGGGLNAQNVSSFLQFSGVTQVHSSAKGWLKDETTSSAFVSYAYHEKDDYDGVDGEKVKAFVLACQ